MQMDDRPPTQRLVLTARLKEGARERAVELVGSMPTPLETDGFEWLSVYLSESEVVFLTEAPEAELLVRQILDDPGPRHRDRPVATALRRTAPPRGEGLPLVTRRYLTK